MHSARVLADVDYTYPSNDRHRPDPKEEACEVAPPQPKEGYRNYLKSFSNPLYLRLTPEVRPLVACRQGREDLVTGISGEASQAAPNLPV